MVVRFAVASCPSFLPQKGFGASGGALLFVRVSIYNMADCAACERGGRAAERPSEARERNSIWKLFRVGWYSAVSQYQADGRVDFVHIASLATLYEICSHHHIISWVRGQAWTGQAAVFILGQLFWFSWWGCWDCHLESDGMDYNIFSMGPVCVADCREN